jgi:hypothetical protein
MTQVRMPVLQARQLEDGGWYVAVAWPDGRKENIGGFASESETSIWIAATLRKWIDDHEFRDNRTNLQRLKTPPYGSSAHLAHR